METTRETGSSANISPILVRASTMQNVTANFATGVEDRAIQQASTRNLEGTNLTSHNSFALLDNDDIYCRTLEMGVDPSSFNFDKIDCMKDLEIATHNLAQKQIVERQVKLVPLNLSCWVLVKILMMNMVSLL
jgi:hypothetical protein